MLHKCSKVCGLVFFLVIDCWCMGGTDLSALASAKFDRPSALASSGNLLLTSHYHFSDPDVQLLLSLYDVTIAGEEALHDITTMRSLSSD